MKVKCFKKEYNTKKGDVSQLETVKNRCYVSFPRTDVATGWTAFS